LYTYSADDNIEEERGGLEDGPAQSNASRPYPDEENAHVTNAYACANPLVQSETNNVSMRNFLNEVMGAANNSVPFSSQLARFNDCTCPSIQSLAFPTLFLFGNRDVTFHNRNMNTSLIESNHHLLRYCI